MVRARKKAEKAKRVSKGIKQRLLREGVKLLGRDAVATHLRVPLARVTQWLHGVTAMPDGKLPRLADRMLQSLSARSAAARKRGRAGPGAR